MKVLGRNPHNSILIVGLSIFPVLIFMLGCVIHHQRGYYYMDLKSTHAQGADDAYISYRYGWNLTHFGTLSWNETGYRRTEGFSNPLWVYLSAGWSLLGRKDWIYPLMVITSVVLSCLLLFGIILQVFQENQQSGWAVLGLFFAAATPFLWMHSTSGLESGVFGLALALLAYMAVFSEQNRTCRWAFVGLSIFIGLLRSDGFVYLAIILIASLIAGKSSWKWIAIGIVASFASLIVWRQIEFGSWWPNTAVAKLNFSLVERVKGGLYHLQITFFNATALILILFGVAGLLIHSTPLRLAGAWIILAWIAVYLYIGGDPYIERHLVGLFFLLAAISAPLWTNAKMISRILLVLVFLGGIVLSVQQNPKRFDYSHQKVNDPWVMLGKAMEMDRSRYGIFITSAAGKMPFYAGGDCIDTYGLNDPQLAKIKRHFFSPGHSAGSDEEAIEIAEKHPVGIFSTFSFLDPNIVSGPADISLWVDNFNPQAEVQRQVTLEQWNSALNSGYHSIWSIISQPIRSK